MGIIKQLYYIYKSKFRKCELCNGEKSIFLNEEFLPSQTYEGYFSNCWGKIAIKCPACKGNGIVWG